MFGFLWLRVYQSVLKSAKSLADWDFCIKTHTHTPCNHFISLLYCTLQYLRVSIRKSDCLQQGGNRTCAMLLLCLFKNQVNMKTSKTLLTALLLLALPCVGSHAQQLLSRHNLQPRSGDRLMKQQIAYKSLGRSGRSVLWNLGEVDVLNERYGLNYLSVPSHQSGVTGVEHGTRYYYAEHGDTLVLEGVENNGMRISYDEVPVELPFPLQYGNELEGIYHGRGIYCDKTPYREYGRYHLTADAIGTLILPTGDTLRNVVRVHNVRMASMRFYAADSLGLSRVLPVFTRDSVEHALSADTTVVNTDIYRWYAPGYRYPVLETVTVGAKNSDRLTTAFLLTPEEQAMGINDAVNEPLRGSHSLAGNGRDVGFSYNITRTDGNEQIRLDYILEHESMVSCQLVTAGGAVVWQQPTSRLSAGTYTAEIPSEAVRQGVNLLSFKVDGKIFTEKFTVRK